MTEVNLGNAQPAPGNRRRAAEPDNPATRAAHLRAELAEAEAAERAEKAEAINSRQASGPDPQPDPVWQQMAGDRASNPFPAFGSAGQQVSPPAGGPANPYAPTGWRAVERVTFDMVTPSGQHCQVLRLERDDVINLGLMQYLDTFTPVLLADNVSDAQREMMAQQVVQDDPSAIGKLFQAVDKVVMAATLRPKVTDLDRMVYIGTPQEWSDPNFTATVHIRSIDALDRMAIFNAAFGRSMDDLKSVWGGSQAVMDNVADVPVVQQDSQ